MNLKSTTIYRWVLLLLCFFILLIGFRLLINARTKVKRENCLSLLRGIGSSVAMYARDHNGEMPDKLEQLIDGNYLTNPYFFVCPSSGHSPRELKNVSSWTDYNYIPLSSNNTSVKRMAILFDKNLSYHSGKGINVVIVGTDSLKPPSPGTLFWDSNAEWLRSFAKSNPKGSISMPE